MNKWPGYTPACIKDIAKALSGPLVSGYRSNKQWGVGPRETSNVYTFERAYEKKFGVKHCVAMNSGTMALVAAIKALELPPGSGIVTTPYSFSATPASIVLAGHVPQFADVDPLTYCLDPKSVKRTITKRTRAILNVDLFGYLPDYEPLKDLGLPIIQDACQSQGAVRGGKALHGVIAVGSGNGQKNLPVVEGGWAYTNNAKYAERMRHYISHGENFEDAEVGVNGRMHELVGILAFHGLKDLDERNQRRRDLANILLENRYFHQDLDRTYWGPDGGSAGPEHVFYCTPFKVTKGHRDSFIEKMARRKYVIGGGYISPALHRYKAFRQYATRELPVVDELSSKTLCLVYDLTPNRPLSYAHEMATTIRECLS